MYLGNFRFHSSHIQVLRKFLLKSLYLLFWTLFDLFQRVPSIMLQIFLIPQHILVMKVGIIISYDQSLTTISLLKTSIHAELPFSWFSSWLLHSTWDIFCLLVLVSFSLLTFSKNICYKIGYPFRCAGVQILQPHPGGFVDFIVRRRMEYLFLTESIAIWLYVTWSFHLRYWKESGKEVLYWLFLVQK